LATDPIERRQPAWQRDDVLALINEVVAELAPGQGEPTRTARLIEDLGYHSLALLELAFSLEDEFDLDTIDEPTARKIVTVQHVVDHVLNELIAKRVLV
jgi:acyl carrier protein